MDFLSSETKKKITGFLLAVLVMASMLIPFSLPAYLTEIALKSSDLRSIEVELIRDTSVPTFEERQPWIYTFEIEGLNYSGRVNWTYDLEKIEYDPETGGASTLVSYLQSNPEVNRAEPVFHVGNYPVSRVFEIIALFIFIPMVSSWWLASGQHLRVFFSCRSSFRRGAHKRILWCNTIFVISIVIFPSFSLAGFSGLLSPGEFYGPFRFILLFIAAIACLCLIFTSRFAALGEGADG